MTISVIPRESGGGAHKFRSFRLNSPLADRVRDGVGDERY
ncbi:hypothetical protein HSB1_14440 [Halogranum salarium B-1]|uniref:Uncharacterized protein n=1 Tax=Halogranum salarium B-1 TaxID=1210908 RepID=J3JHB5_9EURY|nr:hypothetical protein HSB1_14440 [Halogranum salarium B-1]